VRQLHPRTYMVSAFRRSLPHGTHNQTTLLQLHGVLSNAGAVKARKGTAPEPTGARRGDPGGDGELEDKERGLKGARRSGNGALLHVRHKRRWRARRAGVAGGFMVQFFNS
jgi:hypothetical protein